MGGPGKDIVEFRSKGKKTEFPSAWLARRDWQPAAAGGRPADGLAKDAGHDSHGHSQLDDAGWHPSQSRSGRPLAPNVAVSACGRSGPNLGFAELYGDDVGEPFRPGVGPKTRVKPKGSRPPWPVGQ